MSNLVHLKAWCDRYYKKTNLKVHPQNIPVEILIDELLEHIAVQQMTMQRMIEKMVELEGRLSSIEAQVHELNVQFVELESKTGHTTFQTADDIQKRWKEEKLTKPTQKVDKKEVKK